MSASETYWWATQAALLDPRAYHLIETTSGGLDVTVPTGEAWYAANAFALHYNEPTVYAQDAYPLHRRSGFLRPLDCRRPLLLSEGTRIRSNALIQQAYLYYCAPASVWSIDSRYQDDPRALYFERLVRMESLPIRELVCEAIGGGSIDDVVQVAIPNDFEHGMVIGASVYDACWATFGLFNLMSEVNNSHTVRFAESLLCPFPRNGIGGDFFALKKGTYSDEPQSKNPAIAYPCRGSANVLYQVLPSDW